MNPEPPRAILVDNPKRGIKIMQKYFTKRNGYMLALIILVSVIFLAVKSAYISHKMLNTDISLVENKQIVKQLDWETLLMKIAWSVLTENGYLILDKMWLMILTHLERIM